MLNQRVKDWFSSEKDKGRLQKYFAEKWGLTKQRVSLVASGSAAISIDIVTKILDFDKDLNARWLILGEEVMYETTPKPVYKTNETISFFDEQKVQLKKIESSKDETIAAKDDLIKDLQGQVSFLKNIIEEKL